MGTDAPLPRRFLRLAGDPLNGISLAVFLVWVIVGIWFRPIGDFGVETDFYGDFVPFARGEPIGHVGLPWPLLLPADRINFHGW